MTATTNDAGLTFVEVFDNEPSTPEQRAEVYRILHGPELAEAGSAPSTPPPVGVDK